MRSPSPIWLERNRSMIELLRIQQHLAKHQVSHFLVSNLHNVQYLIGLQSTNALLLLTPEQIYLYTDPRYASEVTSTSEMTVRIGRDLLSLMSNDVTNIDELYVDEALSYLQFEKLTSLLPKVRIEMKPKLIEELRIIKTSFEIQQIEAACEITSEVWRRLITEPFIGQTEKFLARRIHSLVLELDADGLAFDSIVAAGVNSASPHHTPTDYIIRQGDFIKCDFGAKKSGYHSDMTRMAIAGVAAAWQQEVFEIVTSAQAAGVVAIQTGVSSRVIDDAARSIIESAGYGDSFTHPTGHGIGLEIHEIPIHGSQDITLCPSMTLTVEPGIYLEGKGGVRLEDTLVVLEAGTKNLTMASKALAEVE